MFKGGAAAGDYGDTSCVAGTADDLRRKREDMLLRTTTTDAGGVSSGDNQKPGKIVSEILKGDYATI